MVPTAQLKSCTGACLKTMHDISWLIFAVYQAFECRMLGYVLQGGLCVQLGYFAAPCTAISPTGFVQIGWKKHFTVHSWPISSYPPGADQGMEKQTGLVTHKHNQDCGPVWLYNCWRIGEHTGREFWTEQYEAKLQQLIPLFLMSIFAELFVFFMDCCKYTIAIGNRLNKWRPAKGLSDMQVSLTDQLL